MARKGAKAAQNKRAGKPNGVKKKRAQEIELVCKGCKAKKKVPSQEAYKLGGNTCYSCIGERAQNKLLPLKMSFK